MTLVTDLKTASGAAAVAATSDAIIAAAAAYDNSKAKVGGDNDSCTEEHEKNYHCEFRRAGLLARFPFESNLRDAGGSPFRDH
jgi:hypothetical protein